MVIGEHPGFELRQSLFDLRRIQFHNALHSLAFYSIHVVMIASVPDRFAIQVKLAT
jgi:hypothetical protein